MKEKLLCVLEKHAEKLRYEGVGGTYHLSFDKVFISLYSYKNENIYKILFLDQSYSISKEEFDKVVNFKKEKEEFIILEQLDNLC